MSRPQEPWQSYRSVRGYVLSLISARHTRGNINASGFDETFPRTHFARSPLCNGHIGFWLCDGACKKCCWRSHSISYRKRRPCDECVRGHQSLRPSVRGGPTA